MPDKIGIGFNAFNSQVDHLAVICVIMNIPLLFANETDFVSGEKYYPGLNAQSHDYQEFTPEYLLEHYDVLFMSDVWNPKLFHQRYQALEKKHQKLLRSVFCPHGFSDKGFYFKTCVDEDIILVYGQNMLDLFKENQLLEKLHSYVIVGNYRYQYYKQHQQFYDQLVQKEIWDKFAKKQSTILYAPTWRDQADSSTFFQAIATLLDHLPPEYNMLVKLHPRLELDDIGSLYQIIGKYEQAKNIVFLTDFPPVYPILSNCDLYIGDMSSIGYDFLVFDRPMFFLNKDKIDSKTNRNGYLYRCGIEITPEQYVDTFKIIEQSLASDKERFSKVRNHVYEYTFAKEKPFKEIKEKITQAYMTEKPFKDRIK